MTKGPIEKRAKELLKFKLAGEPINFSGPNISRISEEIDYLVDQGYLVQRGETPKSLRYDVTSEGMAWALA